MNYLQINFYRIVANLAFLSYNAPLAYGEMAEWFKAPAWKACSRQRVRGSNPLLSATLRSCRASNGGQYKLSQPLADASPGSTIRVQDDTMGCLSCLKRRSPRPSYPSEILAVCGSSSLRGNVRICH